MSRDWNGLSLQNEFAALLSDESTTFKARVLGWINDVQNDIASKHDWPFMRQKGKKLLTASSELQTLYPTAPGAPTAAVAAGGSLTSGSVYTIGVTFFESVSGYETTFGATTTATPSGANLTINLTNIPVSTDPLVTGRKVYIAVGSGNYLLYSTISDNTSTTLSITANTSSLVQPPDYSLIKTIDGNPFFETAPSTQLVYKPLDQIRLIRQGVIDTGDPFFWSDFGDGKIVVDPKPSIAYTLSFYYFKMPSRLYASVDSQPELPISLKNVINAGVLAMGYEYRDRDGQDIKKKLYDQELKNAISRFGRSIKGPQRVRDVIGNSNGFEI